MHSTHLLDVNVLIALTDSDHVHHTKAKQWFLKNARNGWATCPLTENGFIRIVGHPNYPNTPGSSNAARMLLNRLCAGPGHLFWHDSISMNNKNDYPKLPESKNLTDYYLLALSLKHKGKLATLDQRINPDPLSGGRAAYAIIDEPE